MDLVVTMGGALWEHATIARRSSQRVGRCASGKLRWFGKPVLVGTLAGGTPWIGLPGNPGCAVGYLQFVHTWLRRSWGVGSGD